MMAKSLIAALSKPRWAIVSLALAFLIPRLALIQLVPVVPESDALSYLAMAHDLAAGLPMQDQWGQFAFYSAGYPIILGIAFMLAGEGIAAVICVNLALGVATMALIARLTASLGGRGAAQWLAAIIYALNIPAAYAVGMVAKENLTTPLLLAVVLAVLNIARAHGGKRWAIFGGAAFGFGLIAGGSTALVGVLFPAALIALLSRHGWSKAALPAVLAAFALTLSLGAWLGYTHSMVGSAVLNTNGGFNIYLGNNPAATGSFVGIEDTPMAAQWEALREEKGEAGAAQYLQSAAFAWISANPSAAARLAVTKLGLFWMPNIPDAADAAANPTIAAIRWVEVAQYLLIIVFGGAAALALFPSNPAIRWVVAAILLFWLLHAAAYVMPRYREPVMPLVIVLAAAGIGRAVERFGKGTAHG